MLGLGIVIASMFAPAEPVEIARDDTRVLYAWRAPQNGKYEIITRSEYPEPAIEQNETLRFLDGGWSLSSARLRDDGKIEFVYVNHGEILLSDPPQTIVKRVVYRADGDKIVVDSITTGSRRTEPATTITSWWEH